MCHVHSSPEFEQLRKGQRNRQEGRTDITPQQLQQFPIGYWWVGESPLTWSGWFLAAADHDV